MKKIIVTMFAICMSACAADPAATTDEAESRAPTSWQPESLQASQDSALTGDDTADASPIEDAIEPHAGCSVVQFCNAPGNDGTRCRQQGCSLGAALAECERESRAVCGTPVCPWIFVELNGTRLINDSCL